MAQSEKRGLFVRESTGLVKNVSFFDAISINVSYMSIGAGLGLIGITMSELPTVSGVNLIVGSAISFLMIVPMIIVYTLMSRRISRTGGDYVWLSRSLGGFIGSTVTFTGMTFETMPYLALIALSLVFAVGSVGVLIGVHTLQPLATGSSPLEVFGLAEAVFGCVVALNVFRPNWGYRLISATMVTGIATLFLGVVVLLTAGRSGFEHYIDTLGAPGISYSTLISSYTGPTFSLWNTLLIVPFFALFSYPWFNASPSIGSELKGKNAVWWAVPVSALVGFTVMTAPLAAMYYVGGFRAVSAALSNPTLVYNYSLNFWTLAMGVSGNPVLRLLIGLGWVLWTLAIIEFGVILISRYLLAQAFDRTLPESFAYVSPKYGSPVVAHLVDFAITTALIGAASYFYGSVSSLYGAVLASMVYFAFVGAGAVVYALRKERGVVKLALATSGALMVGVFLFISYEFLDYPSVWGGNPLAYGYIVGSLIAGSAIYLVMRQRYRSVGLDIRRVFEEIPPE
ncbi:MAG: APC family permease [Thermoprotei archaeon]